MSTERVYQAALIHLEQELDGFVGAAFVEVRSGRFFAAHSVEPGLDQRALVEAARAIVTAHLELGRERRNAQPEEVIVTTGELIHLYELISADVLLVVNAARDETNLALVRAAARRCGERLRSWGPSLSASPASAELQ